MSTSRSCPLVHRSLRCGRTRPTPVRSTPSRSSISTAAVPISAATRRPWRPRRGWRIPLPLCVLIRPLRGMGRRRRWRWRLLSRRRLLLWLRPLLRTRRSRPRITIAVMPLVAMVTSRHRSRPHSGLRQGSHGRPCLCHPLGLTLRSPETRLWSRQTVGLERPTCPSLSSRTLPLRASRTSGGDRNDMTKMRCASCIDITDISAVHSRRHLANPAALFS